MKDWLRSQWRRCWTVLRLGRELRASRADLNEWQRRALQLGEKYTAEVVRRVRTQLALRISERELAEVRAERDRLRLMFDEIRVRLLPENYSLAKIQAKPLSEFRAENETELP